MGAAPRASCVGDSAKMPDESPDDVMSDDAERVPFQGEGVQSEALLKQEVHNAAAVNLSNNALKWGSLALIVVQNSSLFVVTRFTRAPDRRGRMYLASVVVLIVELCKMLICLLLLLRQSSFSLPALHRSLHESIWIERSQTARLAIPATCYAIQNNLVFVAISNLSAAAAQVLYQLKTLSTAIFTVLLLGRSFKISQWVSFVMLAAGVVLVQSQDGRSSSMPTGANPSLGVAAALFAAGLSGFAGVYLEKMFTTGSTSLWMRNVQLCIWSIPLQCLAIAQTDRVAVSKHGFLQGFHASTWLVVAIQVGGALLTAVVIKHAGNVLKTFATVQPTMHETLFFSARACCPSQRSVVAVAGARTRFHVLLVDASIRFPANSPLHRGRHHCRRLHLALRSAR